MNTPFYLKDKHRCPWWSKINNNCNEFGSPPAVTLWPCCCRAQINLFTSFLAAIANMWFNRTGLIQRNSEKWSGDIPVPPPHWIHWNVGRLLKCRAQWRFVIVNSYLTDETYFVTFPKAQFTFLKEKMQTKSSLSCQYLIPGIHFGINSHKVPIELRWYQMVTFKHYISLTGQREL